MSSPGLRRRGTITTVIAAQTTPRRRRALTPALLATLATTLTATLGLASIALADATQSSNWAGYAAHSSHVRFTHVFGAWRQPSAVCSPGTPTYSSQWVGLGGYAVDSSALAQIGSELDCDASGKPVSTVWYELVPAPSRRIRMTVALGDQLAAAVTVTGHLVRLQLSDLTRHTSFLRTVDAHQLDLSSADWIVEAPLQCTGRSSCQQLPLADFGTTAMTRASTRTSTGRRAGISDPLWRTTAIALSPNGRRFVGSGVNTGAEATPSRLGFGGTAFAVTYGAAGGSALTPASLSAQTVRGATLTRPGLRPPGPGPAARCCPGRAGRRGPACTRRSRRRPRAARGPRPARAAGDRAAPTPRRRRTPAPRRR